MIPIKDTIVTVTRPFAVWTIVAVNGVVFAITLTLSDVQQEWLFYMFGMLPARYSHPRWAQWQGFPAHDY